MKETRKCMTCGRPYIAKKINAKYCSKECARTAYKEMQREHNKNKKKKEAAEKQKKAESRNALNDYALSARAAGLSYGKYQAQTTLQRIARRV